MPTTTGEQQPCFFAPAHLLEHTFTHQLADPPSSPASGSTINAFVVAKERDIKSQMLVWESSLALCTSMSASHPQAGRRIVWRQHTEPDAHVFARRADPRVGEDVRPDALSVTIL